jgi:hypothetical protein
MVDAMSRHWDDLMSAPLGAALLDRLEAIARRQRDSEWFEPFLALPDTREDDVAAAARWAAEASHDDVLRLVLEAGELVGPWHGSGPQNAARAMRLSSHRVAIADAVLGRAEGPLTARDMSAEQWWWTDSLPPVGRFADDIERLGPHFAWVTAPRGGLWSTAPVDLALAELLTYAWEVVFGPLSIWRLDANPSARVYEIHSSQDWRALVERYPLDASEWAERSCSWELSASSFPGGEPADTLLAVAGQTAARRDWGRVLMPDWAAVAVDWDAVHLSWLGFVTTEGRVLELDNGDVTILRNWCSERTNWLTPRLDADDEVLRQPNDGRASRPDIVTARSADDELAWLRTVLQRHR